MHASVRHLPFLLLASLAVGGLPAAAASPTPRVPWFRVHLHRSDCLVLSQGLGGTTCLDTRSTERDVFLFRDGRAISVTTTSRHTGLPGSFTVVRQGTATAAQLQAVRTALATARLALETHCNPFPNGAPGVKHLAAHYELAWYEGSGRLDLSTSFTRPCPQKMLDLIDELVRLGSRLPAR